MADIDKLTDLITKQFEETNKKLESLQTTLQTDIAAIRTDVSQHNDRLSAIERDLWSIQESSQIDEIKIQIETLKQDRLSNNIRLTSLPTEAFENPTETVFAIDNVLELSLIPSDFTAYADRHKSSLIISFTSYSHKRTFMNTMQQRKSLLVEEVFPSIQSNANIYANDQLTPYFAKLFQTAWQAKKEGKVFSASSLGGRIKVKLIENGPAIPIQSLQQLTKLLGDNGLIQAQNQPGGSSNTQNDYTNGKKNDNNSIKEDILGTKSQQPASNNPALQRYIGRNTPDIRDNRPSVNKFSSKIRSDLKQHRIKSRDRYRGEIDVDTSPPPRGSRHSNGNRAKSYGPPNFRRDRRHNDYEGYNDSRDNYYRRH